MMRHISLLLAWLIGISVIIGPLCLGSYFGHYRYPLLILTWLALILSSFTPTLYTRSFKPLLGCVVFLTLLGLWMTWNSEAIFTKNPWWLQARENQPFKNLPGAADVDLAWDKMLYIIPCLGIILISSQLTQLFPSFARRISLLIFSTGAFIATLGIFQYIYDLEHILGLYTPSNALFFGTFRSPGIASCYLNISLSMGLSNLFYRSQAKKRFPLTIALNLGCYLLLTGIILTSSKAGIALAAFILTTWTILNFRRLQHTLNQSTYTLFKGKVLERNLAILLCCTIAAISMVVAAEKLFTRIAWAFNGNHSTWVSRKSAFEAQITMMNDSAWLPFGYGPGSFMPYFRSYHGSGNAIWVYAHNDYLQTATEWGPIGFLCFAFIFIGALWGGWKAHCKKLESVSKNQTLLLRGCLIAVTATLLHALVDFPFQIESIAFTIAVIVGILWGHYKSGRSSQKTSIRTKV